MQKNLIFDASVLVTAWQSGNIYKTGIYRVSYEILSRISCYEDIKVYLFDVYRRERELRKHIAPEFKMAHVLPIDSKAYKLFVYPLFNLADDFRIKEYNSNKSGFKLCFRFLKNSMNTIGAGFRYLEKKRKINNNILKLIQSDIYFSSYNLIPTNFTFLSNLRKAIIIHDLIPILRPDYFYNHDNKKILEAIIRSITEDNIVICVSESTRQDFLHYRPSFDPAKVFVAPLAGATCFRPILSIEMARAVKEKYNIPYHKSYYLSVCTIEPRKNIGLLIAAYERLLRQIQGDNLPLLVLTGPSGWKIQSLMDNIDRINTNYPKAIILTGFVSDEELAVLYSNTVAFLYPSLNEGFGLPPLEAMQCGAPVITSNNSSLPEVVGSAGIMIDANDEYAMLNALITCLDNEKVNQMREKSKQQAAIFSWNRTVEHILDILRG